MAHLRVASPVAEKDMAGDAAQMRTDGLPQGGRLRLPESG